ncbi:hypothetical protein [Actibacterium lipolyticum]|uniref:Uncharacterized protein n=1 Tax=Actibacterium lipolyticum TaxID=1524263 RepID=A0A238KF47_9RHOB|nr:hypothetical protein [Actibacterium lipolyticum]SMX41449.1 hypothetical protein COL8621_01757 [Actibacterium lipolyticum]
MKLGFALLLTMTALPVSAQHSHTAHGGSPAPAAVAQPVPTEPGQSAFAALAEIVGLLRADPATDWSRADIPALREHLVDMELVTTQAKVDTVPTEGGARFVITGIGREIEAIQAMAIAHPPFAEAEMPLKIDATPTDNGAEWVVTGDQDLILALGFHGLMTIGAHHQEHHLAIATGNAPHN